MTKTTGLQKTSGWFHHLLGIRASLIGVMVGLLLISLTVVFYSVQTLNSMRAAMTMLTSQELSGLVITQQISNVFTVLNDELQSFPFIDDNKERQQVMARIDQMVKRLFGELQQMGSMNGTAFSDAHYAAVRDLEIELEQLDKFIKRYDQITGQRIAATKKLKTHQAHIDQVYNGFVTASEDANRQMRALVSRALAVNIPDAAKKGKVDQELDAFLEREMSWLGTTQDLRNDGRELKVIADAVSSETEEAAIDKYARQAAAASLRLFLYKRLPQTPVVQNLATRIDELTRQFAEKRSPTLFSSRKAEIALENQAQTQYDQITEMSRHLQRDAAKMEIMYGNMTQRVVQKADSDVHNAKRFLLGFSLVTAVLCIFILYYMVGIRIIRRIEGLTKYMHLSASETKRGEQSRLDKGIQKIIGSSNDEIAAMGKAFIVFVNAILAEKSFSEVAINSLPGIFYMYDRQGHLVLWNRNVETIFGYTPAEIKDSNIMTFIAEADQARVQSAVKKTFTEGYGEVEAELITKDSVMIPYYLTGIQMTKGDTAYVVGTGIELTELKKSVEALKESERKYRELVENANSIILRWSPDGEITFMNEFGQKFFGYSEKEIIGRHVLGTIVPESKSTARDLKPLMDKICANPKNFEQNINENMRRNGERVWISWTNKAVLDRQGQVLEVLSIGSDITELRRTEKVIKESESKYRSIFENAIEGIFQATLQGQFLSANPAMARMLRYDSPEELISSVTSIGEQFYAHPEDRSTIINILKEKGIVKGLELQQRRKDGSVFWTIVNVGTVKDGMGNILYLEGTLEDITSRKQAEEALRASLREKEILIREIHHRVKNNLSVILGLLSLQADKIETKEQALAAFSESRDRIYSMALVHQRLYEKTDLSRIDMENYIYDISSKLKDIYAKDRSIIIEPNAKDVSLDINIAVPLGLILNELITNAMKYAFPDNREGTITLSLSLQGASYCLSVSDNGVGLPEEIKEGTFGMELINLLNRQIDGTMDIQRDKGTRFTITFPCPDIE
ncbi:MAG: hypothetical protein C0392_12285 [Syntrophus sp. (in: bacteria)]|nr:hypothetical protein [Syntrophus sp. (in: bacteria)]